MLLHEDGMGLPGRENVHSFISICDVDHFDNNVLVVLVLNIMLIFDRGFGSCGSAQGGRGKNNRVWPRVGLYTLSD